MVGWQRMVFDWAAGQSGLTGLTLAGAGLVAGLHGFHFRRLLLAVGCGLLGYLGGASLAPPLAPSVTLLALAGGLVGITFGAVWPVAAAVVAHTALWAGLAGYGANQVGLHGLLALMMVLLGAAAGCSLTLVSSKTMTTLSTSVFGSGLIILGLVTLAQDAFPVIGDTFRTWARQDSPVVGVLLIMLAVTLYSYQSNARRGDLRTGLNPDNPGVCRIRPVPADGDPAARTRSRLED